MKKILILMISFFILNSHGMTISKEDCLPYKDFDMKNLIRLSPIESSIRSICSYIQFQEGKNLKVTRGELIGKQIQSQIVYFQSTTDNPEFTINLRINKSGVVVNKEIIKNQNDIWGESIIKSINKIESSSEKFLMYGEFDQESENYIITFRPK